MKQKQQGILFILGAAFCFAGMNLFVRMAGELPVMQKVFFRNLVAMLAAGFVLIKNKESFRAGKGNQRYLFLRSFIGLGGVILNFYAIDRMNIADASMLNKLSPFFAVIFSIFILKEKAKPIEWGFILLAFTGALFVIKPQLGLEIIPALCGTMGGMCAGAAYTYVRLLSKRGERGKLIVFYFSAFSCLLTGPVMLAGYQPMERMQWIYLLGAGCAAAGGQFFITAAYSKAPAKDISVFDYAQVIFAAVLGFVFLTQFPDGFSLLGYLIILCAAAGKWRYLKAADMRIDIS